MKAYLIAGLAVLALSLGAWGGVNQWRAGKVADERDRLQRELTAAQAVAAFQKRSAEIAQAQRIAAVERADRAEAVTEALLTGDFDNADLVLDPRIGALLECLRTGGADCGDFAGDTRGPVDAGSGE